ncbi:MULTISPECIES: type II secretion system major pseudopilin GspG [unclassified Paludibacterium]|uniref:type II secretion system major pseudopilin GspG n=1 Tax=unclassified Paludibacterium TaxID=2618429 RepID=UPI001C04109F|nr:type II secretion system major pseudopilin GspG [Paludibacterium sp. B53371]BEV73033.1 type II secretion system major pseudopilin GspG [Paludibacterium sp. THUN1379]
MKHKLPRQMPRLQAGFSLLELLVVILIIALLTSVIGPRLFQQVSNARVRTAQSQMKTLQDALVRYRLDTGAYPDADQGLQALQVAPTGVSGWMGPYLQEAIPADPWGHPYIWRNPGQSSEVEVASLGSDGKPGGSGEAADLVQGF